MKMIKLAIVDDHSIFVDGVQSILEDNNDIECLFTASSKSQLLQNLKSHTPDIILMDISLGQENGIEITNEISSLYPKLKFIALSMHHEENYIIKMLEAGASGYLLKDAGSNEMIKAIKTVAEGKTYYSDHVASVMLQFIKQDKKIVRQSPELVLSKRELEILKLVCMEKSNQEIADQLYISIRTVDTHKRNLIEKIDVKNTIGLVKYAIKYGLID